MLILSLSRRFTKTFLLIDALDEVSSNNGFNDWRLLLAAVEKAEVPIKLLVTSRLQDGIERIFKTSPIVHIRANNTDVQAYITSRISNNLNLVDLTIRDPSLEEEIVEIVSEKVGEMFLLARFELDHLGNQTSPRNARRALSTISGSIADIYNEAISRIRSQSKERAELGIRVLSWIYHARRPLEADELRHALAVEPGDHDFDESGLQTIEVLLGICSGLASLDAESGTVRLVHYTIQEHFDGIQHQLFTAPQVDIAQTCLTYLMFTAFTDYSDETPLPRVAYGRVPESYRVSKKQIVKHRFLDYAANNWLYHLQNTPEPELFDLTLEYVTQTMRTIPQYGHHAWSRSKTPPASTPLEFAVGAGLTKVVHALVEGGAEINTGDIPLQPLIMALESENEEITRYLLDKGASTILIDDDFLTGILPVFYDARFGDNFIYDDTEFVPSDHRTKFRWELRDLSRPPEHRQNIIFRGPSILGRVVEGGEEMVEQPPFYEALGIAESSPNFILPGTARFIDEGTIQVKLDRGVTIMVQVVDFGGDLVVGQTVEVLGDMASVELLFQDAADTAAHKRHGKNAISIAGVKQDVEKTPPQPQPSTNHDTSSIPDRESSTAIQSTSVELPIPEIMLTAKPSTTDTVPITSQNIITAAPGKPNKPNMSEGLTHYVGILFGFSMLIYFVLFYPPEFVGSLFNRLSSWKDQGYLPIL